MSITRIDPKSAAELEQLHADLEAVEHRMLEAMREGDHRRAADEDIRAGMIRDQIKALQRSAIKPI